MKPSIFHRSFRNSEGWQALSPTGKVPVLRDDGFAMFESGAMLQYLLAAYGAGRLQPRAGTQAAAWFQQWSWFAEATCARPLGENAQHTVVRPKVQRIPAVVDDARQRASVYLQALEVGMDAGPYLLGDAFPAADVNMGYSLVLAECFGLIEPGLNRVVSCFDALKTRPHFVKALTL